MSRKLEELPLFPLHSVLFPYSNIRLFVFEERYKLMVQECVQYDRPFGVVLIRAGQEVGGPAEPYMVGTVVRISKVDYLEDGHMDVQVQGERRFRIREIDESHPYLVGMVEPIVENDIDDIYTADRLFDKARTEFSSLIQLMFANQDFNVEVRFAEDPVVLSFTIASLLVQENLERQRLLETTDTMERIEELLPLIQVQNAILQRPDFVRLRASDLKDVVTLN